MFIADVKSSSTPRRHRLTVLLAVLTVIATTGQLPTAAAETGGAGGWKKRRPSATRRSTARGMWVWYVDRSTRGSIPAIVAQARRSGIGTVYVKAGDGGDVWSQFSRGLVRALHRGGLDVCAWQFVYGDAPVAEARVAAAAVAKGADCFAIDAEGDYEGKYAAADLYVRTLRARGRRRPSRSPSPPSPTSTTTRPSPTRSSSGLGGATFNQPQMYWKTIGTSVRAVFEHTYLYNRIWGHPIYPIGQTYEAPGKGAAEAVPPLRRQLRRPRPELVELAGDRADRSGGRSAPTAPRDRSPATARGRRTRC